MMLYPDFEMCKVIVIGDVMLDRYYWGDVSRISPEAPVPVVSVRQKTGTLGGAGNVALNLSQLGCQTVLMGIRGDDSPGHFLLDTLEQQSITGKLVVSPSHPTTTKTRIISHGQQLIRLDEEAVRPIDTETEEKLFQSFEKEMKGTRCVILSDYAKGIFKGTLARKIIERCRKKNIPVFVDPKSSSWSRYLGATCITPNEKEFFHMAPDTRNDIGAIENRAMKAIAAFDLDYLMLTRGKEGIALFNKKERSISIPTLAKEVFDVSGAGDTVIATLTAAYGCGLEMKKAAYLANMAAGIVVGKLGTAPITASELKKEAMGISQKREEKIKSPDATLPMIIEWKKRGKRIVFTNGCFDILHIGHIQLLQAAANLGDKLIIGLNSDSSVKKLKGKTRPITSESNRAMVLASIDCVDLVTIFSEETPLELIKMFTPDVLVKGGDYTPETVVGREIVEENGGQVVLIPLVEGSSTTEMIQRIQKAPKRT